MPSPTMTFFWRPQHSTAVECRPLGYLLAFGFFQHPRGVPRSCNQTHTNLRCRCSVWNQTPFVMDEEKSGSSTLQKKTICYSVELAVRIFPATMRTFTKDTALSEQGRGAAWHVWINARHGRGTACYVWIGLNSPPFVVTIHTKQFKLSDEEISISQQQGNRTSRLLWLIYNYRFDIITEWKARALMADSKL